jgi:hypothetical protein
MIALDKLKAARPVIRHIGVTDTGDLILTRIFGKAPKCHECGSRKTRRIRGERGGHRSRRRCLDCQRVSWYDPVAFEILRPNAADSYTVNAAGLLAVAPKNLAIPIPAVA